MKAKHDLGSVFWYKSKDYLKMSSCTFSFRYFLGLHPTLFKHVQAMQLWSPLLVCLSHEDTMSTFGESAKVFVKQNTSHDTESGQLMLSLNSWKVGRSMQSGTKGGNHSLFDVFCNAFSCHPTSHAACLSWGKHAVLCQGKFWLRITDEPSHSCRMFCSFPCLLPTFSRIVWCELGVAWMKIYQDLYCKWIWSVIHGDPCPRFKDARPARLVPSGIYGWMRASFNLRSFQKQFQTCETLL